MHNGPRIPPFAERFRADPHAVDAIMFQEWGTRERDDGWLAAGIEELIHLAFRGWRGSAVFAEWGYERNERFGLKLPHHEFCDRDHTRRSAWRGAFCGFGIIGGFENAWGPWMLLEEDQPGVADMSVLKTFLTEVVPFADVAPVAGAAQGAHALGRRPLVLANPSRDLAAVYLPVGGSAEIALDGLKASKAEWFDPRTGKRHAAKAQISSGKLAATAPGGESGPGRPYDWILVARK